MAAAQDLNGPPGKLLSFGIAVIVVGFLAMQPDFGQAMLVLFGWGVVYFVAGAPMILIGGILGLTGIGGFAAYNMSEHFARRINGFLTSDIDPRSQLGYATNAIQEGGFWGVGVGEGQGKWTLPDAHTDFIIAVAAEEYGLVLVLVIIALYGAITVRSLYRLTRERDPFTRLAGTGRNLRSCCIESETTETDFSPMRVLLYTSLAASAVRSQTMRRSSPTRSQSRHCW